LYFRVVECYFAADMNAKTALTSLFPATLVFVLSGCGKPMAHREIDIPSAVLPRSDLVCVVDVKAMRESVIMKKSAAKEALAAANESKPGKTSRSGKNTGLRNTDILDVVISTDLSGLGISGQTNNLIPADIAGMAVVHLSTNLTISSLRQNIESFAGERSLSAVLAECTIGGNNVLKLEQAGTNNLPGYFALSKDGRSVFMTLNEKSMASALAPRSSAPDQEVVSLAAAEKTIPRSSQVRMAMVVGESARSSIAKQVSMLDAGKSKDTRNALLFSVVKPFENIRSVMFNVSFATNIQANLAADLGAEEQALQAKNTIEMLLVPALAMAPGNAGGLLPADVLQRIDIVRNGSIVNLSLKLNENDLNSIINPPSEPVVSRETFRPGKTAGDAKTGGK
jgi:hypothetical protein